VALIILAALTKSIAAIIVAAVIAVALFICASLVQAALSGIYAAALFRYAEGNKQTAGFDSTALANAFAPAR
jgi:hypothetical protein